MRNRLLFSRCRRDRARHRQSGVCSLGRRRSGRSLEKRQELGSAGGQLRQSAPSGIIGNVFTYEIGGKQYVGVLSGAVGDYAALSNYTALGGRLTVFGSYGK